MPRVTHTAGSIFAEGTTFYIDSESPPSYPKEEKDDTMSVQGLTKQAAIDLMTSLDEYIKLTNKWFNEGVEYRSDRTILVPIEETRTALNAEMKAVNNWVKQDMAYRKEHPFMDTLEIILGRTKFTEIKRPIPRSMLIKQNRILEIYKSLNTRSNWIKKDEVELRKLLVRMQNFYIKHKSVDEDARREVKNMRTRRKKTDVYLYHFKRGPVETKVLVERSAPFEGVKVGYRELRRLIEHERLKQRMQPRNMRDTKIGKKLGGVYTVPGGVLHAVKKRGKEAMFKDKSPTNSARHVGIELEFCSSADNDTITDALSEVGMRDLVTMKTDGSLRVSSPGDYSHELCILCPEKDVEAVVTKICTVLKDTGGYINQTCGMHVHLDMRSRNAEQAYFRLVDSLDILYQMTPPDRRFNKYCKRNTREEAFTSMATSGDRYWAINASALRKHKTLEARLHTGSLNPLKIKYWVQLLSLIAGHTGPAKVYRNIKTFVEDLKVPADLAVYMKSRIAKFAEDDSQYDEDNVSLVYDPTRETSMQCTCGECANTRRFMARNSRLARSVA